MAARDCRVIRAFAGRLKKSANPTKFALFRSVDEGTRASGASSVQSDSDLSGRRSRCAHNKQLLTYSLKGCIFYFGLLRRGLSEDSFEACSQLLIVLRFSPCLNPPVPLRARAPVMTTPQTTSASYEVGYRKPPRHTQFQKGQSGNPGGRPRRSPAGRLEELALYEAYRATIVTEDGHAVPMPVIQAILRRQLENAAGGNVRAQRDVLAMIRDIERARSVAALFEGGGADDAVDDDDAVDVDDIDDADANDGDAVD